MSLSVCLSVFLCLSLYLSVCLFVTLSLPVSLCLSLFVCQFFSACLSMYLFVCLFVCLLYWFSAACSSLCYPSNSCVKLIYQNIQQDSCITGDAHLGFSDDPAQHYFHGTVSAVDLKKLLTASGINLQLPRALATTGFPRGLKVKMSDWTVALSTNANLQLLISQGKGSNLYKSISWRNKLSFAWIEAERSR